MTMARREFGSIERRDGRYYAAFKWQGRVIRRRVLSRAVGARKLAECYGLLDRGCNLQKTLEEVFGDIGGSRMSFKDAAVPFLAWGASRWKKSTHDSHAARLNVLTSAPWASAFLPCVRPEEISRWIQGRLRGGEGKRAVTVAACNRDLALGSRLYGWAQEAGYVEQDFNPFRRVSRFSEKGRAREVFLTAGEAQALIGAASDIFRPVLQCAFATGMRQAEIRDLQWRDIDQTRRELYVRPENEKAGRGRVIPLTPDLAATLKAIDDARKVRDIKGEDSVFVDGEGAALSKWACNAMLDAALAAVGDGLPVAKRQAFTFHAARHTAASLMAAAGVPLMDIGRILGHSTPGMVMRYAHFAPQSGRAAIDKLAAALDAGKALAKAQMKAENG